MRKMGPEAYPLVTPTEFLTLLDALSEVLSEKGVDSRLCQASPILGPGKVSVGESEAAPEPEDVYLQFDIGCFVGSDFDEGRMGAQGSGGEVMPSRDDEDIPLMDDEDSDPDLVRTSQHYLEGIKSRLTISRHRCPHRHIQRRHPRRLRHLRRAQRYTRSRSSIRRFSSCPISTFEKILRILRRRPPRVLR